MNPPTNCPHCSGRDIVPLPVVKSVDPGWVGFSYKALGSIGGTEPLLADLCQDCGTVLRFWVENSRRRWVKNKLTSKQVKPQ